MYKQALKLNVNSFFAFLLQIHLACKYSLPIVFQPVVLCSFLSNAGTLELKLNSMPMPAKNSRSCTLNMLPTVNKTNASSSRRDVKLVSLFEQKRLRGFWPCSADVNGQQKLTVSSLGNHACTLHRNSGTVAQIP